MAKKSKEKKPAFDAMCCDNIQQAPRESRGVRKLYYKPPVHILLIAVLGLLIYSNTFHSPFQWDEETFIINNPVVHSLSYFVDPSKAVGLKDYGALKSRYIGYLTFALNYRFGGRNVTGYHIVNFCIHVIDALLVYFLVLLTFRTPYFSDKRLAISDKLSALSSQQSANNKRQETRQAGKPASYQADKQSDNGQQQKTRGDNPPSSPLNLRGDRGGLRFADSRFTIHDSRSSGDSRIALLTALFTGLFFVAHPVQTEAVTYVFQRLASLVTMFYLLSIVFYIKGRLAERGDNPPSSPLNLRGDRGGLRFVVYDSAVRRLSPVAFYLLSLLFAVLAMKTKENAFTLPIVITLYEFYFFEGRVKTRIARLLPLFFTMLIIPLTFIGTDKPVGQVIGRMENPSTLGYHGYSVSTYLLTQFRVIITYIRLLFLPVNQDLNYAYPAYHSLSQPPVILSFLFLLCLFGLAGYLFWKSREHGAEGDNPPSSPLRLRGDRGGLRFTIHDSRSFASYYRLISFGILWFFITLSVESSIIPIPMLIDEYRVYLPSVGAFIAMITAVLVLLRRPGMNIGRSGRTATILLAVTVCMLSGATYARNNVWKDSVSLWKDVLSKSPGNPGVYVNLGRAYDLHGEYKESLAMADAAIALAPSSSRAWSNRGLILGKTGKTDEAIKAYEKAISLNKSLFQAYYGLGMLMQKKGLDGEAMKDYMSAIEANPYYADSYIRLGVLCGKAGLFDKAIENFNRALSLKPNDGIAYNDRGFAYSLMGKYDRALEDFNRAIETSENPAPAYVNRGSLYLKKGHRDLAASDFQKACSLKDEGACDILKSLAKTANSSNKP